MAHIIVIDDEFDIRQMMMRVLIHHGYTVSVAENGKAGLKLIRATPDVSLVITDLVMPDIEGIELIHELHKERPELPIIAISGGIKVNPTTFLKTASILGAKAVLQKPFELDVFVKTVASLLQPAQ